MKIGGNFRAFDISSSGMKLQKKKLDLIAENIANTNTTKTADGTPYKRKTLVVEQVDRFQSTLEDFNANGIMKTSNNNQFMQTPGIKGDKSKRDEINMKVVQDTTPGDKVYMPDHPDSDKEG